LLIEEKDFFFEMPALYWGEEPLYPVKRILLQEGSEYYVEFVANDLRPEWIHESNLTDDLLQEWRTGEFPRAPNQSLEKERRAYNGRVISLRSSKRLCNRAFAQEVRSALGRGVAGRVLYLESEQMLTSDTLLRHAKWL
jgi:hypothetical protein